MIKFRSVILNLWMVFWALFMPLIFLPFLLLPRASILPPLRLWAKIAVESARVIAGIRYKVEGLENIPDSASIICSKHQSAWETIFFCAILKNPVFVLKKELQYIPLIGFYMHKLFIFIDRSKRLDALKTISRKLEKLAGRNSQLIIFPEGTRVKPGEKLKYHRGFVYIYEALGVPIVPVALNTGVCWPKKSWLKYPGEITIKFLPVIPANLEKNQVAELVEQAIEGGCLLLAEERKAYLNQLQK